MIKYSFVSLAIILSILCGAALLQLGYPDSVCWTAAITVLTAVLWMTEALPIPVSSLVPFVLLPLGDVISHKQAAESLGAPVILLLMAAFMLSKGIERSNVHQRFAIHMLALSKGRSAKVMVVAFALTSAFLSMWISNTATTLMMLPIALAIVNQMKSQRITISVLLAIAYGASIGGIATPIGTPPNIIFMSVYEQTTQQALSFAEWMSIGLPLVLIALPIMLLILTFRLPTAQDVKLPQSGPWSAMEKRVLVVFLIVIGAWISRVWWGKFDGLQGVGDSTIALAGVLLMFVIPSGDKTTKTLLDWPSAQDIPWGMLLLFGGGICLAKGFTASGLSDIIGQSFAQLTTLPLLLSMFVICISVTFLTEITSNTATATLLMPILASVALGAGLDPRWLMIPAVVSASCAFMLPVATAPNAIVYSSGEIPISTMAKRGALINICVAAAMTLGCYWLLS